MSHDFDIVWSGTIHRAAPLAQPIPDPPTKRPKSRVSTRAVEDKQVLAILDRLGNATLPELKAETTWSTAAVNNVLWRLILRKMIRRCLAVEPGRRQTLQRYARA